MIPDLIAATSAKATFTHWCDARPTPGRVDSNTPGGREIVRREHERSVQSDLIEADAKLHFRRGDFLVLNTFRHWALRGIVDWLEWLGPERAPMVVLILHFTAFPSPESDDGWQRMYRDAFQRIEASRLRDRFIMMADSEGLIAEYEEISSLDFILAPIPHAAREIEIRDHPEGRAVNITYAGEARYHKGFHLLPWLIRGVERSQYAELARFTIQTFCGDPHALFFKQAMAKIDSSCVALVPEQLDEREYQLLLDQADVILAPYLIDNYYVQTSGIYAEAIAMGKPVVVSRGTWMASQIHRFGGGKTFPPDDAQGLLDACLTTIAEFDRFSAEAKAAAKQWNAFHNADHLIDLIISAASDRS
jgi:glycosyltransferase involved in cell wall biosynthesis